MHRSWCFLLGLLTTIGFSIGVWAQECSDAAIDMDAGTSSIVAAIDIADDVGIDEVATFVDITHPSIDELSVFLDSPEGTAIGLYVASGAIGVDNLTVTFTDSGVDHGEGLFDCDCDMKPSGPGSFADFVGERSSGPWSLSVIDLVPIINIGTLEEWCVTITGCVLLAPMDLTCEPGDDDGSVDLTWVNDDPDLLYTAVAVYVDGEFHESLASDAESTTVTDLDDGRHLFHVAAENGDCASVSSTCSVALGFHEVCAELLTLDPDAISTEPTVHEVTISGPDGDDEVTLTDLDVRLDMFVLAVDTWTVDLASPAGTAITLHSIDDASIGPFDLVWSDDGIGNGAPYDCRCDMLPTGPGTFADLVDESSSGDWVFELASLDPGLISELCIGFHGDTCVIVAPEDLTCEFTGSAVDVAWTNPVPYTALTLTIVQLNDATTQTIALDALDEGFSFMTVEPGVYEFSLTAYTADDCLASTGPCELIVFGEPAGIDLFEMSAASLDFGDAALGELPADFFDPGSLPFDGPVSLQATHVGSAGPFELGTTDVLIQRHDSLPLPEAPSEGEIPIELVSLQLNSIAPIIVTAGGLGYEWDCVAALGTGRGDAVMTRDDATSGSFSPDVTLDVQVTLTTRQFVRLDANLDSTIDLGDPIKILKVTFLDDDTECPDACDVDDDGDIDIIDFFAGADYIFLDGDEPPAPFPAPGVDPTEDSLGCTRERVIDVGDVVLTGTGDWDTDGACTGEDLRVTLLPLGNCRDDLMLTGSGLSMTLISPSVDPDRPEAEIDAGAVVDADVDSIGRDAVVSDGASIGADSVIGRDVFIGENVVIGTAVVIGAGCSIGAETVVEDGVIIGDSSEIGVGCTVRADSLLGDRSTLADGASIGSNTTVGADGTLGSDAEVGDGCRIGHGVSIGNDAVVLADLIIEDEGSVADDVILDENILRCSSDLGGGRFVGTVSECEDAGGAILAHLPQPRGVLGSAVDSIDVLDAADLPVSLALLADDVSAAGELAPDGAVIDRSFVFDSYDAEDFAADLEASLDDAGYDARMTLVWEFEPHPDHAWWNQQWTPALRAIGSRALTAVVTAGGVVFVEPQTGTVGVDLDADENGTADWATSHGPPVTTDGNKRLETYDNRAAAEAAGVVLD